MRNLTKIIAVAALAIASGLAAASADTAEATLDISLTDLRATSGTVYLAIYDAEQAYADGPALTSANVDVSADTASITVQGLTPGAYAIKMYHDVNGNGEMDTNPFGMPTEPYAFSNNAKARFGPAKWDAAAFEVTAGTNTHAVSFAH